MRNAKRFIALLLAGLLVSSPLSVYADELTVDITSTTIDNIAAVEETVDIAETVELEDTADIVGTDNVSDNTAWEIPEDIQYRIDNDPGILEPSYADVTSEDDISLDGVSQTTSAIDWPNTRLTASEREFTIRRAKEVVASVLTEDMSDIEKYWTLEVWIENNIEYPDLNGDYYKEHIDMHDTPHGAYGALKNGYAVCQGDALLYMILCHAADLPCDLADSDILNHAYNYVPNVNGNAYYIDSCWQRIFVSDDACGWAYGNEYTYANITNKNLKHMDCSDNAFTRIENGKLYPILTKNWYPAVSFDEFYHGFMARDHAERKFTMGAPYVEKGSGERGKHIAHYTDYALKDERNTGNWEIDDFYEDPVDYVRRSNENDLYIADISGYENWNSHDNPHDFKTADECVDEIRKYITVSFEEKPLKENRDYVLSYVSSYKVKYDYSDTWIWQNNIAAEGINGYTGEKWTAIYTADKVSTEKPPKKEEYLSATVEAGKSIKLDKIAKTDEVYDVSVNTSIAAINEDGTVTGVKEGFTTAVVEKKDVKYTVDITVTATKETLDALTIVAGGKVTNTDLMKTAADKKCYKVAYSVKNIVAVNNKGVIQGKKPGNVTVTVTKADKIVSFDVVVINPVMTKTFIKNTGDEFNIGFDTHGVDVTYVSNKPAVATVDENGNVKTAGYGSAKITAIVQGKKYSTTVKAYDPSIKGVSEIPLNKTKQFKINRGYGKTQWSSSDPLVATVDAKGRVKGISAGNAIITAVNNGRTMEFEVTVK